MRAKLLAELLLPLDLSLELALLALVLRRRRPRAAGVFAALALAILWAASTPRLAGFLMARLERRYAPVIEADSPKADAIVVLGGALASRLPPRPSPELVDASDRVLHAARLYRAGKAPLVVASGGRLPHSGTAVPESREMADLLNEWGVPSSALLLEARSVDTHLNAVETHELLQRRGIRRILLVTSALHMPRAAAAFRRAGFDVLPSPTDFAVVDNGEAPTFAGWIPGAGALDTTTAAVREYLGYAYYRARGWI